MLGILSILLFVRGDVVLAVDFPQTIDVLKALYNDEMSGYITYRKFAGKAASENYHQIAYLFASLAASEFIHAGNFKKHLTELGVEVNGAEKQDVAVSDTKKNLKYAVENELNDIDRKYPALIEKINSEGLEPVIRNLTYSWQSEKQHRDIIVKIQSGTGMFFWALSKKIEGTPVQFFVCDKCGSTLNELPHDTCPICRGDASKYKLVEKTD